MKDDLKQKLEAEKAKGEYHKRVWDSIVKPFFEQKESTLIEAFRGSSSTNEKELVAIRMQFSALEALKQEFEHHINTGKMAQFQLTEEGK